MAIIEMREVVDTPDKSQYGATGTLNYAGYLSGHEYNPSLQGDKWIEVVDKMLADPVVSGIWQFLIRPISAASWEIEPGKDEQDLEPEQREVANWVNACIFEKMADSWVDHLNNFLTYLKYGRTVFEKCFAFDPVENKWYWQRMAPRQAKTIIKWNENGGVLESITQQTQIPVKDKTMGMFKSVDIPATKLMYCVEGKEGNNYEGRSLFRSLYKPWFRKDTLEAIEALTAERFGMGIPQFKIPTGSGDKEKREAYRILANLAAHENLGIVTDNDWEFILHTMSGQGYDIQPAIHSCIEQMAFAMLVQFAILGTTQSGSRAVGEVQQHPYYLAIKAITNDIEQTWAGAIRELVDYNFSGVEDYPKLKCGRIENVDTERFSNMVKNLYDAGLSVDDDGTESFIRDLVGLPPKDELPEDDDNPAPDKPAGTKQEQDGAIEACECHAQGFDDELFRFSEEWSPWREPVGSEFYVALADIASGHQESKQRMLNVLESEERKMVEPLANAALTAAKAKNMGSLENFRPPKLEDFITKVESVIADDFRRGSDEVKAEVERQRQGKTINPLISQRRAGAPVFEMRDPERNGRIRKAITGLEFAAVDPELYGIPPDVWAYIENSARMLVAGEAAKLKRKALMAANQMMLSGDYDLEILKQTINDGVREGLPLQANLYGNSGFGLGRDAESRKYTDEVAEAHYSAVLDRATCGPCSQDDGASAESYEQLMAEHPAPNPDCLGTVLQCRCMAILTLKREERARA